MFPFQVFKELQPTLAGGFKNLGQVIRSLFANGEQGVWYDPSDLSTLFQDSAGTTPVTAVEQPVGLMLDKSKGLVLGPELVTNGGFSNTSGWSGIATTTDDRWYIKNGRLTKGTFNGTAIQLANPLVAGKTYKIQVDVISIPLGNVFISLGNASYLLKLNVGTQTAFLTPTDESLGIRIYTGGAGGGGVILDNISVRELPGNHAYQKTATSRPVLSARYNLLTKTEQFDDAIWSKFNGSVTANAGDSPLGTSTADLFTENTDSGPHMVRLVSVNLSSRAYRLSLYVKARGRSRVAIGLETSTFTTFGAIFDLSSESVVANYGNAPAWSSIEGVGNGWMLVTIENTQQIKDVGIVLVESGTTTSYTGDGTSGIYIWGASLVTADQANLPYQRVNTATDYDTTGFPHYLYFDGVDDWLVTNTITPGTDKAQVFAGVRKLSDATTSTLVELSSSDTNAGMFYLRAPENTSNRYSFLTRGSSIAVATTTSSAYVSPTSNVLTSIGNISGDSAILRINGTQAAISTANQGTGNFLAYPLYIGRRGGTTLPFNGHLYSLIVRFGANLPIATIENTEKYINTKTRAY